MIAALPMEHGMHIEKSGRSCDSNFRSALAKLKQEGRYRVFADIMRARGAYPKAGLHTEAGGRPITVWCSNDYLNMGQHPKVTAAMHEAVDRVEIRRRRPVEVLDPVVALVLRAPLQVRLQLPGGDSEQRR